MTCADTSHPAVLLIELTQLRAVYDGDQSFVVQGPAATGTEREYWAGLMPEAVQQHDQLVSLTFLAATQNRP